MKLAFGAAAVVLALAVSGCLSSPERGGTDPGPSPESEDSATNGPHESDSQPSSDSSPNSGGPSSSDNSSASQPSSSTDAQEPEPLTNFEESLAETWRRYHVKNSGERNEYSYYEYVAFNENRTACRWKYGEESSTDSTDDVFDSSDYAHWEITEELSGPGTAFRVVVQGRGLDYVFDFTENRVYPAGFETLVFTRTTDGKSCVYRGGASY